MEKNFETLLEIIKKLDSFTEKDELSELIEMYLEKEISEEELENVQGGLTNFDKFRLYAMKHNIIIGELYDHKKDK